MHLPIDSYLEEHSQEIDIAGENVNNPFGPNAENSREKQHLEKGKKKQRPPKNPLNILFDAQTLTLVL